MKKTKSKIMGVALVAILLASMTAGLAVVPAAASPGTNVWEPVAIPRDGTLGGWLIADDAGAGQVGPIAKAIDGTLYSRATPAVSGTATQNLFKSADGGHTWADTGYVTVNLTAIATSPTDANVLFITDGTDVWKSVNAGATFVALATPAVNVISSLDCWELGSGRYLVLIGEGAGAAAPNVWTYDETVAFPAWTNRGL